MTYWQATLGHQRQIDMVDTHRHARDERQIGGAIQQRTVHPVGEQAYQAMTIGETFSQPVGGKQPFALPYGQFALPGKLGQPFTG